MPSLSSSARPCVYCTSRQAMVLFSEGRCWFVTRVHCLCSRALSGSAHKLVRYDDPRIFDSFDSRTHTWLFWDKLSSQIPWKKGVIQALKHEQLLIVEVYGSLEHVWHVKAGLHFTINNLSWSNWSIKNWCLSIRQSRDRPYHSPFRVMIDVVCGETVAAGPLPPRCAK